MRSVIRNIKGWIRKVDRRVLLTVVSFVLVVAAAAFVFGYLKSKNGSLRGSLPSESLAYLEIKDVGLVYGQILKNADRSPTPEFLDGIAAAIAITGFETSEKALTETSSVLNVRPTFAAVAETNAWSWQVAGLIEGPLHTFISKQYGNGVKRGVIAGKHGELTVWTAVDGRKSYAAAVGSRVFFGNDKDAIELCRSAEMGDIPSLLDNKELESIYDEKRESEIFGYFPRPAIEKFANVAGVSAAVSGSEQEGIRTFIARLVPQVLQNSVDKVVWTSIINDGRFSDEIQFTTRESISEVFSETMKPAVLDASEIIEFLPKNTSALTRYRLENPLIAYRSLLLTAAKSSDPVSGRLIAAFSDSMLQPYGVSDAEAFLATVGPELITFQIAGKDDSSAAIAMVKDPAGLSKVLTLSFGKESESSGQSGFEVWISNDDSTAAAIVEGILVLGDRSAVIAALRKEGMQSRVVSSTEFDALRNSNASAVTVARDSSGYGSRVSNDNSQPLYLSETSFSESGITRRYMSRFGLIGTIIAGFDNQ